MPRWARWAVVGLAAALVLLVLVLAVLPTVVDVDRYKDEVVARVESALGREITLDRLSLAFLPTPTLALEGLVVGVSGAPAEGPIPPGERFVTLDRLALKLRLWPLLRRRVEVSRLVLERPEVVVERDAKGSLSVADLAGTGGAGGPDAGGRPGRPSPLAALLVERIEVRRGSLVFRDRSVVPGREVTTRITDLIADLDDVSLDSPIKADVRATFLSRTPQNVVLSGTIGPLGPAIDLLGAPVDLSIEAADLDLERVTAYVGARTGAQAGALPRGQAGPLSLGGPGSLATTVEGALGAPALDARVDLTRAAVAYAGALDKRPGIPLVLTARTKPGQVGQATTIIELAPITLTLHTLTLTATGRVANPSSPVVDLTVESNEAELAGLEAIVPVLAGASLGGQVAVEAAVRGRLLEPATLDVTGKARVARLALRHPALPEPLTEGEGILRFTDDRASLDPFGAKLGRSPVSLSAEVPDLSRRYVRFALESPRLALDPLLAAGAAMTGASPDASPAAGGGRAPARAGRPRPPDSTPSPGVRAGRRRDTRPADAGPAATGLAADGTVTVAEGTLKGVRFTGLRGRVSLRDGILALQQLTFGLYGGTYTGSGTVDLRGAVPAIDIDSTLERVQANEILSETTAVDDVVYGLLSARLGVKGTGVDARDLLGSLSGEGRFSLNDGRIASFDLLDRLEALVALARGDQPAAAGARQQGVKGTPVKSLSSSVRIDDGRFVTPDLELSAGDFTLTGSGVIGFDGAVAYELTASLPAALARQVLGRDVARLLAESPSGAVRIPLKMGGSLSEPIVSLSGRLLKERLRSKLGEAAGEELRRGLERFLKGKEAGEDAAARGESPAPAPSDPKRLLKDLLR